MSQLDPKRERILKLMIAETREIFSDRLRLPAYVPADVRTAVLSDPRFDPLFEKVRTDLAAVLDGMPKDTIDKLASAPDDVVRAAFRDIVKL